MIISMILGMHLGVWQMTNMIVMAMEARVILASRLRRTFSQLRRRLLWKRKEGHNIEDTTDELMDCNKYESTAVFCPRLLKSNCNGAKLFKLLSALLLY